MAVGVTAIYAALLGLMLLVLKFRVIAARRRLLVDVLDGGERDVTRRMRVHGNFAEHVPMALILMAVVELNGAEAWNLHALGVVLLISRISKNISVAIAVAAPPRPAPAHRQPLPAPRVSMMISMRTTNSRSSRVT